MASNLIPPCVTELKRKKEVSKKKKVEFIRKVTKPSLLECIFNKRFTDRSLYYFTAGTGVDKNTMRDVTQEPTPFWIPKDTEEVSYKVLEKDWKKHFREKQAQYHVSKRPTYRTRQNEDLLQRLYTPDLEEDKEAMQPGLLNIDPHYFKIVQGRPIKEKLDIRRYVADVQEVLKTRLRVGYQRDEALQIEEKYIIEQTRIDDIRANLKTYVDSFNDFLAKDHDESLNLLRKSQDETRITQEKSSEVKELNKILGAIKCQVYVLEEKWRNCKMFQGFLYMVSPMHWRQKYDYIHRKGSDDASLENNLSGFFRRYRSYSTGSGDSLEELIGMFLSDTASAKKPELYFTHPSELNTVFQELELQNLNCLLHSEEMEDPINTIRKALEETTKLFEAEANYISDKIIDVEEAIKWEEQRAEFLSQKANELLNGLFKDLVVADSSLSLHVFVEDVYETCIAPNDSNLGLYDMMKGIEMQMESLLLKLDYLPHDIVKTTEYEVYEEDKRIMKEAEDADMKMKLMEKLRTRLAKSLAPPVQLRRGKKLMPRSEPPPIKKKPPKPETPLTTKELDFLNFFTDYCPHVDDVHKFFPLDFS